MLYCLFKIERGEFILDIVSILRKMAEDNNISMNKLSAESGLSASNINHKLKRNSLYFSDVEKLLASIGYHLEIIPDKL